MVGIKKTKKRKDIVIKAVNTGCAVFVRLTDLYQKEALRQLSETSFYAKVDQDLTFINENILKNTTNDLLTKQELLATAKNLTINTPRTLCIYFLPKIHKPNHPGRLSYIKDSQHALEVFRDFNSLGQKKLIFTMDISSLYSHSQQWRSLGPQILFRSMHC